MSTKLNSMKFYILLVFMAITMAFFAGYLSLSVLKKPHALQEPLSIILEAKERFRKNHQPVLTLQIAELFPTDAALFIDPKNTFSQSRQFSYKTMAALYRFSASCKELTKPPSTENGIRKAWTWIRFKCGHAPRLPSRFFETGPFIYPLGGSYASQALQHPNKISINQSWIEKHLHLFHAQELGRLESYGIKLDPHHRIISNLDANSLQAILEEDELALSKDYVFYSQSNRNRPSYESFSPSSTRPPRGYAIFLRRDWDEAFKDFPYTMAVNSSTEKTCIYREGNLCWSPSEVSPLETFRWPSVLLFLLSVGFTGICAWLAIVNFFTQKAEEEQKRLALQILTHELRTPISSLLLSSEEIIDSFDRLPDTIQGTLLRMCNDIGRLQRLAEASQHYLVSGHEKNLVRICVKPVSSVNKYLEGLLEAYAGNIVISYLETDRSMQFDPYWVGICIKNLVDNALLHGKKPVVVSANFHETAHTLEIMIEDAGFCFSETLGELAKPFVKSPRSGGLGLGLTIVTKIAHAMGAGLEFQAKPTKFCLKLSESPS